MKSFVNGNRPARFVKNVLEERSEKLIEPYKQMYIMDVNSV